VVFNGPFARDSGNLRQNKLTPVLNDPGQSEAWRVFASCLFSASMGEREGPIAKRWGG